MITRCKYSCAREYKNYGGRGIKVCQEWDNTNPEGYKNFKSWMVEQGYDETLPRGAQTLDRIDCNGNYSPRNCRLISNLEQQANTRKNIFITYNNETHHISEWSRITGISKNSLISRFKAGLTAEEILHKPIKQTNRKYDFYFNGKHYFSLTSLANDYSLNMKRLSYLLHKGLSIDEAINQEITKKEKEKKV